LDGAARRGLRRNRHGNKASFGIRWLGAIPVLPAIEPDYRDIMAPAKLKGGKLILGIKLFQMGQDFRLTEADGFTLTFVVYSLQKLIQMV
jgi:hypothetical protein